MAAALLAVPFVGINRGFGLGALGRSDRLIRFAARLRSRQLFNSVLSRSKQRFILRKGFLSGLVTAFETGSWLLHGGRRGRESAVFGNRLSRQHDRLVSRRRTV